MPNILARHMRRRPVPFYDGIHLDFKRGVHYIKAPGVSPTIAPFTSLFTFTGDALSKYRGASGLLISSATNTPRIEYDAAGNVLGLLIEGARTNLCLRSQELDVNGSGTPWSHLRASVSANAIAAPDGTTTADKIVEDSTASNSHLISQFFSKAASALDYTFSMFAKAGERSQLRALIHGTSSADRAEAIFTLSGDGTVVSSGVNGTFTAQVASITPYANGWYRFAIKGTSNTDTGLNIRVDLVSAGSNSYNGDGASGLYAWGAQLEQASFASSYIPTTTGSVARAADVITRTFGSEYTNTKGTAYAEMDLASPGSTTQFIFVQDNASRHLYANVGPTLTYDGTNVLSSNVSQTANVMFKTASSFDTGGMSIIATGNAIQTSAYDGTFGAGSTINIGSNGAGSNPMFGHIRRLDYWPERKSNAELVRMTA